MSSPLFTIDASKSPFAGILILLAAAVISLGVAAHLYRQDSALQADHSLVTATVTHIKKTANGSYPVAEYEVKGQKFSTQLDLFSSRHDATVGAMIEFMVSNSDPSKVNIDTFYDRFSAITALVIFAALMVSFAYRIKKPLQDPLDAVCEGKTVKQRLTEQGKYMAFRSARILKDAEKVRSILQSAGVDAATIGNILGQYKF